MASEYVAKLKSVIKGITVVCIDAANLEQSVKDMFVLPRDIPDNLQAGDSEKLKWKVDYKKFYRFFSGLSKNNQTIFYSARFGTENHEKFLAFLKHAGYTLVTKPLKQYQDHTPESPHRKANFDVEIAVDAMDRRETFGTFILFSGDSDFEYLLRYLRGNGKRCLVFSRAGHISTELVNAASQYFDLVDFRQELLAVSALDAKSPAPGGAGPRG